MIRRILARKSLVQATTKYIRGGDGHGGRALPFGRQAPFTGNIPDDFDLVWDDGVAPEPAIDLDHSDVPIGTVITYQSVMAAFILFIWQVCVWIDPQDINPVAPRRLALPTREEMDFDDDHGRAKV